MDSERSPSAPSKRCRGVRKSGSNSAANARLALRRKQAPVIYTLAAVFRRSLRRATNQTAYSFNNSALRSRASITSGMVLARWSRNEQNIFSTHAMANTVFRRGPDRYVVQNVLARIQPSFGRDDRKVRFTETGLPPGGSNLCTNGASGVPF